MTIVEARAARVRGRFRHHRPVKCVELCIPLLSHPNVDKFI